MNYSTYISKWIKQEVQKAGMEGVIVGLSGGIDSAVVAKLGRDAFPNNSLGIIMPIGDMGIDGKDAQKVAKSIKIKSLIIDLTSSYKQMESALNVKSKLAKANIKPRLRMTTLYALAQEKKYLVLGTDNAAEWILGYFTKYGDGGADLLPIINLTKGDVCLMAKKFKLPKSVITKKPSAGLWEGQTDEKELGFSYKDVDNYLKGKLDNKDVKKAIVHQINISAHKRLPIPKPQNQTLYEFAGAIDEVKKTFKELFNNKK